MGSSTGHTHSSFQLLPADVTTMTVRKREGFFVVFFSSVSRQYFKIINSTNNKPTKTYL